MQDNIMYAIIHGYVRMFWALANLIFLGGAIITLILDSILVWSCPKMFKHIWPSSSEPGKEMEDKFSI